MLGTETVVEIYEYDAYSGWDTSHRVPPGLSVQETKQRLAQFSNIVWEFSTSSDSVHKSTKTEDDEDHDAWLGRCQF
jgi:hypothetical protein